MCTFSKLIVTVEEHNLYQFMLIGYTNSKLKFSTEKKKPVIVSSIIVEFTVCFKKPR